MSSVGYLVFCSLALIAMVSGDGWGQMASQGSSDVAASAPAPDSTGLAGGLTRVDLTNPERRTKFYDLANFALQEINGSRSNSLYRQSLIQVQKAFTQVVAGIMYHITLTSGQSTCRNTPENLAAMVDTCPLSNDPSASYQQCTVKVLEQAWRHIKKVSSVECSAVDKSTATSTS